MKKLLTLLLFVVSNPLWAAKVSHIDYASGASITAAGQNTNENAIFNEFNGNIDNTNIKAAGVTSTNLDSTITSQFVPSGTVFYWAGSTNSVPSGYLYCDGSAVSRTTYATLFGVLGTAFGTGNGATTFNLPDMRGRFVRGVNDSTGNDPDAASRTAPSSGNTGDKVGSYQGDQFKSHTHTVTITDPGHSHTVAVDSSAGTNNSVTGAPRGINNNATYSWNNSNTTGITAAANASTGGNESRPINLNMGGIIKT